MLREDQIERYARHILLPDVGGVGQKRLLAAAVVVELGADPAAEGVALAYLAAAGVGRLLLAGDVDAAITDAEARACILLGPADAGRPRIAALAERIAALNPDVRVERAGDARAPGDAPLAHLPIDAPGPGAPDAGPVGTAPDAVAGALIRGGAAAIRTLSRLAKPDGDIEPS